jgi:hypothetical protein
VAVFYADSALVNLVHDEPESSALRAFLADADLVSSELILTEIPRAVRRAASDDPGLPLDLLLERAGAVLEAIGLRPLDRALLAAGERTQSRRHGRSTRSTSLRRSTCTPSTPS